MSHGLPFDLDGMKSLSLTRREYLSFAELDQLLDAIPVLCDRVRELSREAETRTEMYEQVRDTGRVWGQ